MCADGTCYQPSCPHCGPTMNTARVARSAARYPYEAPRTVSPWPQRVIASVPRLIAMLIPAARRREYLKPDPLLMTRISKMLPDRQELAVSETLGILGTTEK